MPKAKPDVVYIHRIEAGEWERQNVLKPIAEIGQTLKIIKTAVFVTAPILGAGALFVAWHVFDSIYGWIDPMKDKLEATKARYKEEGWLWEADLNGASIDPLTGTTTDSEGNTTKNHSLFWYWARDLGLVKGN